MLVRDGGWLLSGWLVQSSGEPVIEQLTFEPELSTGEGVRPSLLRALPITRLTARLLAQLREEPEWLGLLERHGIVAVNEETRRQVREAAERAAKEPLRRGGRAGYPKEHYRRIALRYLELVQQHGSKGVLVRIAEEESRRRGYRVPRETVRDWVRTARRLEFLGETKRGRAASAPGPRLYETKEGED